MKKEFFESKDFKNSVDAIGGEIIDSGETRQVDYNEKCLAVKLKQKITDVFKSSASCSEDGIPKDFEYDFSNSFPELKSDKPSLVIRCEPFFVGNLDNIISYNLSCIYDGYIYTIIYYVYSDIEPKLPLNYLLGRFFDEVGIPKVDRRAITRYGYVATLDKKGKPVVEYCDKKNEANEKAVYGFIDKQPTNKTVTELKKSKGVSFEAVKTTYDNKSDKWFSVTLLVNYGLKLLSSLDVSSPYYLNVLEEKQTKNRDKYKVTENEHAAFSCESIISCIRSYDKGCWNYCYPITIDIRDAINYSCGINDTSIPEIYGKVAGCIQYDFSKTKFGKNFKRCLDDFLIFSPYKYIKYACQVNTDILIFISRLNGINCALPITFTSVACDLAVSVLMDTLECKTKKAYLAKYAGTKRKSGQLEEKADGSFNRKSIYLPLNEDCEKLQRYASKSYRGGYNGCFSVDCHKSYTTYDYDIASAYPTSMAEVPAINYNNPIEKEYRNEKLTLDEFVIDGKESPMIPIFACITYKFPTDCYCPNLPRNNEDDTEAPCYPLEESDAVFCCGPELYVALKMGARIHIVKGVRCNVLHDDKGEVVYPYRKLVKTLVAARADAKTKYGEKCLLEIYYKFIVNSLYGKISQHVSKMYSGEKTDYKESEITCNASAALITAFVRSVIFAASYEINKNGYRVYSATTDGLISDMPFEEFNSLPLFGLREYLVASRSFITGEDDPKIWEIKHQQDDLNNFSTRGNASLNESGSPKCPYPGVIACLCAPTTYPDLPKTAFENRLAFITGGLSRTECVKVANKKYTTIDEVRSGNAYVVTIGEKKLNYDFDMKRKIIPSTLKTVYKEINGVTYEIAVFETEPYKNTDEYLLYKKVAVKQKCLRTEADWNRFFDDLKCEMSGISAVPREDDDYLYKKFISCIYAYRAKEIDIPYLDTPGLSVKGKVAFLQSINPSKNHIFTKGNWEKAGEKARQKKRLPLEIIEDTYKMILSACPKD